MTHADEQLCHLFRVAARARTHLFALNLVTSLGTVSAAVGPTRDQAEKVAAADAACMAADKALSDYEAERLAAGPRLIRIPGPRELS